MSKSIKWYDVYLEIAMELKEFYLKHKLQSGQVLYELLNDSEIYKKHNSWLSNIIKFSEKPSIDPIQLFTSFSRSKQVHSIRTEIISELYNLLEINKTWEDIDYVGCPTPMTLKIQYIRYQNIQKQIWETFYKIIENGSDSLTEQMWYQAKLWRGIQTPSFTIFLFWVNYKNFLPLDKNTRQYLIQSDLIRDDNVTKYEDYKKLLVDQRVKNYPKEKIALEAYYFVSDPKRFKWEFGKESLYGKTDISTKKFTLIGLRTLDRNREVHKILKPNTYYPFDNSISPVDKENLKTFIYKDTEIETLYDIEDLKVNITAIVGKNGSGKSTLIDILLMCIYNLSIKLQYFDEGNGKIDKLNCEIYWHSDTLYKLVFGTYIQLYEYKAEKEEENKTIYKLVESSKILDNKLENFFYSILINYSHYALNCNDHPIDWMHSLLEKNDGYKAPLVINPKRTDGNIDINKERDLLNMRLMVNLLELHDNDFQESSFRYIDNGKQIKFFSISYNKEKQEKKIKEAKKYIYRDLKIREMVMSQISIVFKFDSENSSIISFYPDIKFYIVRKLFAIIETYSPYKEKYKLVNEIISFNFNESLKYLLKLKNLLQKVLSDIKDDKSHVTLKLKQAINYLKYPELRNFLIDKNSLNSIRDLNEYKMLIEKIINDNQEEELTLSQLLPPPIFKMDFYIDDNEKSSLSKASSGEYQLISVLSSIMYHIRNIDSIENDYKYNYITVLLDEIELYFHPNMQRLFIKKLIDAFSKMETELYGIHVLFASHSPFILSDIHQQKILKLENGEVRQRANSYNTFASNIHDLLADEFFLDEGYMGAFAKREVEKIINILNYIIANNELEKLSLNKQDVSKKQIVVLTEKYKSEIKFHSERLIELGYWNEKSIPENFDLLDQKNRLYELIEIVGEPLIKGKLMDMYNIAFDRKIEVKEKILQIMKENNIEIKDLQ